MAEPTESTGPSTGLSTGPREPAPELLQHLPVGFVWGAATAAFQIEGDAAGRGRSIWDTFCDEPGRIKDGSNGEVACEHVKHYVEDVALMKSLGVDAYRFSIGWPRVQPSGRGQLDHDGLDFYQRLVDELLRAGIEPWVTLYHWDLPQTLQDLGGWPHRDTAEAFADYATAVHAALGDRVSHWMTLNEPWCSAWLGHAAGVHAPGWTDVGAALRSSHHLLLGHGMAVNAMREQAPADHVFGIVLNPGVYRPAENLSVEQAADLLPAAQLLDGVHTRWWLDALITGGYPEDVLDAFPQHLEGLVAEGDLEVINTPIDFLGVNYYSDQLVLPAGAGGAAPVPQIPATHSASILSGGPDTTTMGWPITPGGFRDLLERIAREYPGVPLVITENGSAWHDSRSALQARTDDDGNSLPIPDPNRVDYLLAHLEAVDAAAGAGVDIRGYFAWSLMDNFEWAMGYTQRFGLIRIEYDTQERRIRQSFATYRDLIAAQRAVRS